MSAAQEIRTVAELQELTGEATAPAIAKERDHLLDVHREWIAVSRFLLLATSGADGTCDVSPKGDPAGFVHVVDDRTVAIPERPGNGRVDGWRNVLENPHVGLILLVPGRNDTMRINGRARLVRDAPYFDELAVKGRRPLLACEVAVDQVFTHCPKAFLRSELWKAATWPEKDRLPSVAAIAQQLARPDEPLEKIEEYYGPSYAERLY
ncbi:MULTISPECIES: pyridoxamine 5'-phosphate oxidase family protein [unclassified Pseudonocardia]|uniref:pyridoxamine 5'-phosphate oxidase family protein n=1 Tax=unclassified Pseudonocardia TaxID=2619320 RepID=UPI0001FFEAF7|nr:MULTISPECIES: pyridoxamine 5'-phosphate oxidase family protein [unclassified Pseudonocardia]ALE75604.1 pyridoxamine 5'-phosphate oxidase [Pseudonocardia sp. EC080625-04]ALL74982.1 pyridoxamine 5'-phosphate oxidase [Pseudonocardia sp. EC080610-09]ALL82004.1 pyridoxamine 5'-phosphate oxidase [Pseudonocardia sp. EC080619-01]OLM21395.1 Phosphohydrolase [Pseudonocardia sp. Ae707_Ps1]